MPPTAASGSFLLYDFLSVSLLPIKSQVRVVNLQLGRGMPHPNWCLRRPSPFEVRPSATAMRVSGASGEPEESCEIRERCQCHCGNDDSHNQEVAAAAEEERRCENRLGDAHDDGDGEDDCGVAGDLRPN